MQKHSLSVGLTPVVMVNSVGGDLRMVGWDSAELMAKTDGDQLEIKETNSNYVVSCDSDLIIKLPQGAIIEISKVHGDADLRNFTGTIKIDRVMGDLSFRNVGALTVKDAYADVILRNAKGDCEFANIHADASLRGIQGNLTVQRVNADLFLRDVMGNISAKVDGSAVLYLKPEPKTEVEVEASGDIVARLPADADTALDLNASSADDIRVDLTGVEPVEETPYKTVLGKGSSRVSLNAGGELVVTQHADQWEASTDFHAGERHIHFKIPDIPIPPDLDERISRKVEAAVKRAEKIQDRVQTRVQAKIDAAMRRAEKKVIIAEHKLRHAEHQARRASGKPHRPFTVPGFSPGAPDEPVSEDERLVILRMLQEKKISLEEAENLLDALEGK